MAETKKHIGSPEETRLEPTTPRGPALPLHLLGNRPFLWLVLGSGVGGLTFWSYFGAMWAEGTYRFNGTPGQISLLLAAFSVPFVLLVPIQGTLVDSWSPKWLNVIGYVIGVAAVPIAWGADSIHLLYLSSFLVGVGSAMVIPARSALTGLMVEESKLVQANGAISTAIQLSIIGGPLYAGLFIRTHGAHTTGTGIVYASSFFVGVAAIALFLLVPDRRQSGERPAVRVRDLGEGFATTWRIPELRMLLALYAAGWLIGNIVFVIEPLFIKNTLHKGGEFIQYVWVSHGIGAAGGAIFMSRMREGAGRELRFIGAGLLVFGLGLVLFYASANPVLGLIATAAGGTGFSFFLVAGLALMQRLAGEEQYGRVTSVFAIIQEGSGVVVSAIVVPLGTLLLVRPTLIASGALITVAGVLGLWTLARLEARPGWNAAADGR
jgi:DHA3 family macrolide efflux protein-like MFS transporter